MEDNKYFLPKLSDFRVGYEYEENFEHSGWEPSTYSTFNVNLYNIEKKISEGIIRVPYLTEEQIEGEGWERFEDGQYDDKKYKYPEIGKIYKKDNLFMSYYYNLKELEVHNNEEYSDRKTNYDGKCLDINTLRLINSLLNII